ncbi:phosphatase domain-containing protein [Dinoroseobacter sp. S375]|uniref:phosphatase domain-containing protein n=1 Tax=Dinoroseobacter sp. S375 TaxID=3415136 RepID=UPI003C7E9AC1
MVKSILHSTALKLESAFARIRPSRARTAASLDTYLGYTTQTEIVLRGRVLAQPSALSNTAGTSRVANIAHMLKLFVTREVADVPLTCGGVQTRSNEEGYFELRLPRTHTPGFHSCTVTLPDGTETECPFLVTDAAAPAMVISDIDDTVLQTGAWSLTRNLWTTFSGSLGSRQMHEDAVALYGGLAESRGLPFFYVSSSPWNLYGFLSELFRRSALPRGPMFLRDLGLDQDKFVTSGHGSHKGDSIDTLLAANPSLPAILCGDTGQEDARIYHDVIQRHPNRIRAVLLRTPGPGVDAADKVDLAALKKTGVPVFAGRDFMAFADDLAALVTSEPG